MLNFESPLGPQYWSGDNGFNSLEYSLSADICIVISQIVAM